MKLSILMPAYNEARTIETIVEKVLAVNVTGIDSRELIIVNDASSDDTGRIIRELARKHEGIVTAVSHEINQGKGAAIRTAVQHAGGDICLIQDADLEYDPAEYSKLIQPILEWGADCVYGSRFTSSSARRVLFFRHALGNKFLTFLSNWFTDLNLTDMETCYKVFKTSVIKTIPIRSNRFGIEPEITAKCAKRGLKIYEVPISYRGRTYTEGKKIGWKDGISAIYTIFKYWLIDDSFHEDYGHAILNEMQAAPNFARWINEMALPHLGETVLEVGAGIGNQTRAISLCHHVVATDHDPRYVELLKNAFEGNAFVRVAQWDITRSWPGEPPTVDSIFCSNVLEHVEDHAGSLRNMRKLLAAGGNLILVVPQGQHLFCSLDTFLNHFRRYDRKEIEALLANNGFSVEKIFSFNKSGVLGWIVKGKIFQRKTLGRFSLKLYNVLVPLFRHIDRFLPWTGLSWFIVAKPSSST